MRPGAPLRQPHLRRAGPPFDRRIAYGYSFPAIILETSQDGRVVRAEGEEVGPVRFARMLFPVLSKGSGSVKLPEKTKGKRRGTQDAPNAVILPMRGRVEDASVLGFIDARDDSDLLTRIEEYMKANPDHEFPWIERHPAGQEVMQDGHGSWLLETARKVETASGHTIKLINRDSEEALEIISHTDKPLVLRARGTGKVLLHSDSADVEVIAGGKVRLTGQSVEVVSEQNTEIKAIEDNEIIGKNIDVLASEDASIAANGDVNIGASGSANFLASIVKLGVEGAVKKLITDAFIALFNAHVHGGVQTGSGVGGPPTVPITESEVATANVEAS